MTNGAPLPRDVLRRRVDNTSFLRTLMNGKVVFSRTVAAMPVEAQTALLKAAMTFDKWEADVIEHDMGEVSAMGYSCWFKIDDLRDCPEEFWPGSARFVLTLYKAHER